MVLLMLAVAGTAMASNLSSTGKTHGPNTPCGPLPIAIAGDTIAEAWAVTTPLPFQATGTTVGFGNDYDEVCPYSGSAAPDVVYAFTSDGTYTSITLDLCNSSYDTKLFVYQDAWTPGAPWACNDDFNTTPCYTYSSKIEQMPVPAGHVYYIVVDGYSSASGNYVLDITDGGIVPPSGACCSASGGCTITQAAQCAGTWQGENTVCVPNPCPPPVPVPCPDGALLEGEPTCQDNYVDNYNGGCNSTPYIWQDVAPQADGCFTLCGKSCTYLLGGGSNRDTDWFYSELASGVVTITVTSEFANMVAIMYGPDCANLQYTYALGAEYVPTTVSYTMGDCVPVGFFVAPSVFSGVPELGYVMNVCGLNCVPPPPPGACCNAMGVCVMMDTPDLCAFMGGTWMGEGVQCAPGICPATPVETKSWGAVKNLYR